MKFNKKERQFEHEHKVSDEFVASHWGGHHKYNTLEITVSYVVGGMNYFTGNVNPRGYAINFNPMNVVDRGNGFLSRSFMMGSSKGIILGEAKRYSEKDLAKWASSVEPLLEELASSFIAGDLAKVNETISNIK